MGLGGDLCAPWADMVFIPTRGTKSTLDALSQCIAFVAVKDASLPFIYCSIKGQGKLGAVIFERTDGIIEAHSGIFAIGVF